jgi:glutathione-regulated potassium-efflux system ancillary protein KefC
VRYEDEREELLAGGIDEVFNFYAKAGAGFAEQSFHLMQAEKTR